MRILPGHNSALRFRLTPLYLAALSFALSGCGSEAGTSDPNPTSPPRATVEVADSSISESELPPGCSLGEVRTIFNELLAAGNDMNRSLVLRRIASQPELNSFFLGRNSRSPTGNSGRNFRTPTAIYRYFAEQSLRGYQRSLHYVSVQPLAPGSKPPSGPFRRPADGPAADDPVVAVGFGIAVTDKNGKSFNLAGKGGINCETGRFYVYGGG